ncbi:MAG TPA: DegT/DnrJ/EryC1/StrS family aminotransferase [Ktedonobacteraceae bacterium]|jgi:dTDP-4-amino-4,6-dideoxygalactose transaminase
MAAPVLGEEEAAAVLQVLRGGQLAQGEQVALFEREFARLCQVRYAIAVSSGTAALHLALLAHGIGPGDEVLTSAFTFAATANALLFVGAIPVFVDITPETYTLNPARLEAALTPRTRAILPVHLYGHPARMREIMQLAGRYHLAVIEDACQAHAAMIDGQAVGSFGTGCFSFYPTKNMTTGEGGMVTTDDEDIAQRVRVLRNQGQVRRYVQTALGHNMRMTELQAAIGRAQLAKLAHFTRQRIANARFLDAGLRGAVATPQVQAGCRHVYHQYTIRVPGQRDAWVARLGECGIETGVYYPRPVYAQPFYRASPGRYRLAAPAQGGLPVTEAAARQVLSLPVHPALSQEDLASVVANVLALCA